MKKNKILIVGNWKMNPDTIREAKDIFQGVKKVAKDLKNVQTVICPPFVFLADLAKSNQDQAVALGAQDAFWEERGSFTGEISPDMLHYLGESYVILGHSERRELGETDEMVAKKVNSAVKAGLQPILCIGEKVRDDHGEYLHFLRNQLINSLAKVPKIYLTKIIIAYEPVWVIGKIEAMKTEDIHVMSIFIKKVLAEIYKSKTILDITVIYGGSVSPENAKDLLTLGEVQGLLVGRASLNPKKFGELLKNVARI